MDDYDFIKLDFCRLLNFHYARPTRPPPFSPERSGEMWRPKEFAFACNVSVMTIRNWLKGITAPERGDVPYIEKAFFGQPPAEEKDLYSDWRVDFRTAHKKERTARDNAPADAQRSEQQPDKVVVAGVSPEAHEKVIDRLLDKLSLTEAQKTAAVVELAKIKGDLESTEKRVSGFLQTIYREEISPEQFAATFVKVIGDWATAGVRIDALSVSRNMTPHIAALRKAAQHAHEIGDIGEATRLLDEIDTEERRVEQRPAFTPWGQRAAEIPGLIDRFKTELSTEPRFGNKAKFILDLLDRICDLPDPALWNDTHLDWLCTIQDALTDAFHIGDADSGDDAINFGTLVPLMRVLAVVFAGREVSNAYNVLIDNELAFHLEQLRKAIMELAGVEIPRPVRDDVEALDGQLNVVEQRTPRWINLQRLDRVAGRIRSHRIGALHGIERLIAILIGKRTDRAPPLAIFRDELEDGSAGPELVIIPAGKFMMGSPEPEGQSDEHPQHHVEIAGCFAAGRFTVTFEEWDAALSAGGVTHNPEDRGWGRARRPAINVSWYDATAYVRWLSRQTGKTYRLLSESE